MSETVFTLAVRLEEGASDSERSASDPAVRAEYRALLDDTPVRADGGSGDADAKSGEDGLTAGTDDSEPSGDADPETDGGVVAGIALKSDFDR